MTTEVLDPQKVDHSLTDTFEEEWKNAISGEEFVRHAHKHIRELYALRDKQQGDCQVF